MANLADKPKVFLVDVSSFFFRAYYAMRPLSSPKGVPTQAIYGFLSMMQKLFKEQKPEYLAFCYDRPEPSFRKKINAEYKANRAEMPEDLSVQIPYMKQLVEFLGIKSFELAGFEADDLIGTLAEKLKPQGVDIRIVSCDKDFAQLVDAHTLIIDTSKDVVFGEAEVIEKWGVRPDQFIDFLSLVGDSSDNIKGVDGVGPKTAAQLLTEYQSLDQIYQNLERIKSASLKAKLLKDKDQAYLAKSLVAISHTAPVEFHLSDLKRKAADVSATKALLEELGFKTFITKLLEQGATVQAEADQRGAAVAGASVNLQDGGDQRGPGAAWVEQKAKSQSEELQNTQGLSVKEVKELSFPQGSELWLVTGSSQGLAFAQGSSVQIYTGSWESLKEQLVGSDYRLMGFDLKSWCRSQGLSGVKLNFDLQLAAYVVFSKSIENIPDLYSQVFAASLPELPSLVELYQAYLKLHEYLNLKLSESQLAKVFYEIEMPLAPILLAMEQKGIALDVSVLREESKRLAQDIKELEQKIYQELGEVFNILSNKVLSRILYEQLKWPVLKKTKTGFSTDADVLEKLEKDYPAARLILDYRELNKLKSTYVDALPLLVHAEDGRLHTHFNQALTTTGRLSSSDPNLQNIPIRTKRGAKIRRAFVAPPGFELLSLDYSQIELRILAHITKDPGLIEAFRHGEDIHRSTASQVFAVPLDQVTPEQRRIAKAVNFGIAYGQGVFGLSESLKISRSEADQIIKTYFKKFHGVQDYMQSIVELGKKQGFVETLFGRRRWLPELQSKSIPLQQFGKRAAINAPIQGSASDIVKMAMIKAQQVKGATLLLQVHDELIFEVAKENLGEVKTQLKSIMEKVVELIVPLEVHIGSGPNWELAH